MNRLGSHPAAELEEQSRSVLEHAVDAKRRGIKVYESLRNLSEVIGTEYGDRVLYELIQNAHDAHPPNDEGRIAIKLVVRSETEGTLYIANGGSGFRPEDVEAIKNIAISAKEIGEGIGNKGLGFRSVEALTDDVRIFSRNGRKRTKRFDGYCFRFAREGEIEGILQSGGTDAETSGKVARTMPRYLVPQPLFEHPEDVNSYSSRGYATVIVVPMTTAEAVDLAKRQVKALADLDVPLLLFLDRIAEFRIDVETPDGPPCRRRLHRSQTAIGEVPNLPGCRMHEVRVGQDRRFLVVRREVDKQRVIDAVRRSISRAPQIGRWLNWKGQPVVSVAVGLSANAVTKGRFYNFLPMGEEAVSPLKGYLDAPFFTDIDRRGANFELPLNETLMETAAEACVAAALSIVKHGRDVPQRVVFDLVAWIGEHARKLDVALMEMGSSLHDAPIIPTMVVEGKKGWASLSEVSIWPDGTFSLLKAGEVTKRVGARLVSTGLGSLRLERLRRVAERKYLSLSPSGDQLAMWSECFARSLFDRKAAPRTWSWFYDDLNRLFAAGDSDLKKLSGKLILLDRSKKLRQAGRHNGASGSGFFVRSETSRGKRTKDRVPLPPSTLARRYRFLDERIRLRQETLAAFMEAGLLLEYDPVQALAGLKSALGNNTTENRHKDALSWVFKVWRTEGARIEDAIRSAELHVPARTGWRPATQTAFSSSWTPMGVELENFLAETAEGSPDCQRARDLLLTSVDDWPVPVSDAKRRWVEFLTLLGVADGLRPIAAHIQLNGWGSSWNDLLRTGRAEEGLDGDWRTEVSHKILRHPHTEYSRQGEAWRLPGQIEHEELSEAAKETFHELVFWNLANKNGANILTFEVGRFERVKRDWDHRILPTPLATFLRSKAWIAVNTREGPDFRRADECWAARTKQGKPPRFMDRVPDTIADLLKMNQDVANLAFGEELGLLDWQSKDTAVERLAKLASVSASLSSHDRPVFRREYRRAWSDVVETGVSLPNGLSLAVDRNSRLETLNGDVAAPTVIVTPNAQRFESRVLSSAGQALLDVGDASIGKVTELLAATGMFTPRQLDGIGVRLLVDDESFAPRTNDPVLTSLGPSWLPEVVVLGHELLAEQLEKGIPHDTIKGRIRAIRVRRCESISLVVDEEDVYPGENMTSYAFEHTELPTLILPNRLRLDWATLAGELSRQISRLIDTRLRFLEPLLLRLALGQKPDTLDSPSDEALCKALMCDDRTIQDHRAALRTDLGHVLHLLMPVIAYFGGVALARQLESDADHAGSAFDVRQWLRSEFTVVKHASEDLADACEQASDRAALRRNLDLDYEKFNHVLLELDESPLSNEAELRRLYDAYLNEMRSAVIDRLRRRYAADFRSGLELAAYLNLKTLEFLEFDSQCILTKETLENDVVKAHVARLLDEVLGEDREADLPALDCLIEQNRRSVRKFATRAIPVVRAWCRRNRATVPEPWQNEDPQAVTRYLENTGLLDFEPVLHERVPNLCRRAECWPSGMPEILDNTMLDLDRTEVEEEERRREREREQREIKRRQIDFAGCKLDTDDQSFAETLKQLAEDFIAKDDSWLERSLRRPRLVEFDMSGGSSGDGGGGHGGTRGRGRSPTDAQRQAMGLAGEYLAYQFLRRRHNGFVDETCWVSENRTRFFGGEEGDDTAGYDFRVKTPQAEWFYEVKSSLENTGEIELTANELRVAGSTSKDGRRRYRILYVPFVFSPDRWFVLELPNPMGEATRSRFRVVGRGSLRLRFERR